jgi:hypothetical protein
MNWVPRVKIITRIVMTNWVHLVGFYVTAYLSIILFKLIGLESQSEYKWSDIVLNGLWSIPLLFLMYGPVIIGGFYGIIAGLDLIGFSFLKNRGKEILFFECILIIPLFINWAFEYHYWLWISLSVSFICTQFIRWKMIKKILKGSCAFTSGITNTKQD